MNGHALQHNLIVFTDLDGCLLNKADYRYDDAQPVLDRLSELGIPLILCSSKTKAEMCPLAKQLNLNWPIVCENGGVIVWNDERPDSILGTERDDILVTLELAHNEFQFRSFTDLSIDELIDFTNLQHDDAVNAMTRQCTEPLIWDDAEDKLAGFQKLIEEAGLQLTRGGRFWHLAGRVTKGDGMKAVLESLSVGRENRTTVAIGDSPIDLPMLQLADIPVIIPQPDGSYQISIDHLQCLRATNAGAAGWAEEVTRILDERV